MRLRLAAAVLLCAAPLFAGQTVYTQHWQNDLRRGPGAYYPVSFTLGRGAQLELVTSKDGWSQVKLAGFKTPPLWLADACLGPQPPKGILDFLKRSRPARMSAAVAAVRGFALRLGRGKPAEVDGLLKKPASFTPEQYAAFKAASPAARPLAQGELSAYDPTPEEEGIGLGVASKVAERGLVSDARAERYLNLLAASLGQASGAYQQPFRVYVMKGEEVNAVSAPGGWIFVTRPLLAACRSEAELAAVLAHEMTHVIRRHGLQEADARRPQLKADEAMAELDEQAGPGPDEGAQAELEDMADAAFDAVHKPRLQKYEEEADRGAAALLARAGYDPNAVPRMIQRVAAAVVSAQTRDDENPFAAMDYSKRKAAVELYLRTALPGVTGAENDARLRAELKL